MSRHPAFVRYAVLERGYDIGTVQELPGHREVRTSMPNVHVVDCEGLGA